MQLFEDFKCHLVKRKTKSRSEKDLKVFRNSNEIVFSIDRLSLLSDLIEFIEKSYLPLAVLEREWTDVFSNLQKTIFCKTDP